MLHSLSLGLGLTKVALPAPVSERDKLIQERLNMRERALRDIRSQKRTNAVKNITPITPEQALRHNTVGTAKRYMQEKALWDTPSQERTNVIKDTSFVTPKQALRHNTVGTAKRFWGGTNAFNSKWKNRAALLGGVLGAAGVGTRLYNDAQNAPRVTALPPPGAFPQVKMGGNPYVHDTAFIPPPVKQPRVPSPGPSTKALSLIGPGASASSVGLTTPPSVQGKTKAASDSTDMLMAGGAGGLGGWWLGEKMLKPLIAAQEQKLQAALTHLQNTKKYAPIGAAAAGAIILAAVSQMRKQRDKRLSGGMMTPMMFQNQDSQPVDSRYAPYDKTNAGFVPNDLRQLGQYY